MDDKHLYFQSEVYWQFDNNDQEVVGFSDRFDGGYAYVGNGAGSIDWLDGNCLTIWESVVCFEYVVEELVAPVAEVESETMHVSGHC
jgi:hypothetical protein